MSFHLGVDSKAISLLIHIILVWDRMTSEEAVLLTAAYMKHKQCDLSLGTMVVSEHKNSGDGDGPNVLQDRLIPKTDLPNIQGLQQTNRFHSRDTTYPDEDLPGTADRIKGNWVFDDSNAATHIIRNSVGDGDEMIRRQMMSAVGMGARNARDDITAM